MTDTNQPTITRFIDRTGEVSIEVSPDGVNMPYLVNELWRLTFVELDENDQETVNPAKELGSDYIGDVVALLTEAGLCPPLHTYTIHEQLGNGGQAG